MLKKIGLRISIHAAREGGDDVGTPSNTEAEISIHAAREGGDAAYRGHCQRHFISIHAAREGGDARHNADYNRDCDFNPRRP